jgi:hypothetical protein
MKKREIVLYGIAAILSATFILIVIKLIISKDMPQILWMCYISILLIIVGILKKNSSLILSQVIILAIPALFWVFDFIYLLFTENSLIGIAGYFPNQTILEKIVSFQHFYTFILALIALYLIKVKKNYKILLLSLAEVVVIFFLTLLFAAGNEHDINCINLTCVKIVNLNFLPYHLMWFILLFSFIVLSYFIITTLLFVKNRKK